MSLKVMSALSYRKVPGNIAGSICKHLIGNKKIGVPTYKNSSILKIMRGINIYQLEPDLGYGPPLVFGVNTGYFSNPFLRTQQFFRRFSTQTEHYDDSNMPGAGTTFATLIYTAISSFNGNSVPIATGYPPAVAGRWAIRPPYSVDFLIFEGTPGLFTPTDASTNTSMRLYPDSLKALSSVVSGEIDYSGNYSMIQGDLTAQTWNWSVSSNKKSYNEPSNGGYNNYDGGTPDPSSFDMSLLTSAVGGPNFFVNPFPCVNGWVISAAGSAISACIGMAKNTTGIDQPYFIARWRGGYINSGTYNTTPFQTTAGVTYVNHILDFVETGIIKNNGVIGYNQFTQDPTLNRDLPFPTSTPFPITDLGNSVQVADFYFAVIGDDPTAWAIRNNLTFGTSSSVT